MAREMTPEEFDAFIGEVRALGEQLRAELAAVDEGSTEEQIKATAPRDPDAVQRDVARHEAAARESSLAEARAYAETALALFKTFAAAGAAG